MIIFVLHVLIDVCCTFSQLSLVNIIHKDDFNRDGSTDSKLASESQLDKNSTGKTQEINIDADNESSKNLEVRIFSEGKGAHVRFHDGGDVGHKTDDDLREMIRTSINLPASTNHHST